MSLSMKGVTIGLVTALYACGGSSAGLTAASDYAATTPWDLITQSLASPDFKTRVAEVGARSMTDYAQSLRALKPSSLEEGGVTLVITVDALSSAVARAETAAAAYPTLLDYWHSLGVTDADLEPEALSKKLSTGFVYAQMIPTPKTELGVLDQIAGAAQGGLGAIGNGIGAVGNGIGAVGNGIVSFPNNVGGAYKFCKAAVRVLSCRGEEAGADMLMDPEFTEGVSVNPGLFNAGLDAISTKLPKDDIVIRKKFEVLQTIVSIAPQFAAARRARQGLRTFP